MYVKLLYLKKCVNIQYPFQRTIAGKKMLYIQMIRKYYR